MVHHHHWLNDLFFSSHGSNSETSAIHSTAAIQSTAADKLPLVQYRLKVKTSADEKRRQKEKTSAETRDRATDAAHRGHRHTTLPHAYDADAAWSTQCAKERATKKLCSATFREEQHSRQHRWMCAATDGGGTHEPWNLPILTTRDGNECASACVNGSTRH